jgi:hypothetical protein
VSAPYAKPCIERYRRVLEHGGCDVVVACAAERLEEEELLRLLPGVHGIICGDDRITARVLAAATDLRVISKWGPNVARISPAKSYRTRRGKRGKRSRFFLMIPGRCECARENQSVSSCLPCLCSSCEIFSSEVFKHRLVESPHVNSSS